MSENSQVAEAARNLVNQARRPFPASVQELVDTLKPAEVGDLTIARFREFPVSLRYTLFGGDSGPSALELRLRYPPKWDKVKDRGGEIELPAHMRDWHEDGTVFLSHSDGTVVMIVGDERRVLTSGDIVMLLNHVCDVLAKRGVAFRGDLCFACKRQAGAEVLARGGQFSQLCGMCRDEVFDSATADDRLSTGRAPGLLGATSMASLAGAAIWAGVWTGVDVFFEAMFKNRTRIPVPDVVISAFVLVFGGLLGYAAGAIIAKMTPARGALVRGIAVASVLVATVLGELVYHGLRFKSQISLSEAVELFSMLPELWSLEGNNPAFRFAMVLVALGVSQFMLRRATRSLP